MTDATTAATTELFGASDVQAAWFASTIGVKANFAKVKEAADMHDMRLGRAVSLFRRGRDILATNKIVQGQRGDPLASAGDLKDLPLTSDVVIWPSGFVGTRQVYQAVALMAREQPPE